MNALARADYLKVIYQIQEKSEWVALSALAGRRGLAASSITSLGQKLEKRRYLDYTPYYGFKLIEKGRRLAVEVLCHHLAPQG